MGSNYTTGIKTILIPILFLLLGSEINNENIGKITFGYVYGVVVGSIIALLREKIPHMQEFVSYKATAMQYSGSVGYTRVTRVSGVWGDPNYYSVHLILCIILCAILFSKKKISNVSFYFVYIFTAIMGALTGSKSFLLMLVIVSIFIISILARDKQYSHLAIFIGMIFIAVVYVLSGKIDIFSFALDRLLSPDIEGTTDLTTGRSSRWVQYSIDFIENPTHLVFGTGVKNGFIFNAPHNTYFDFLTILGILGTALFWTSIWISSKRIWRNQRKGTIYPILILAIMYFFLSMIFNIEFVFELVLGLAYCYIAIDKNQFEY